VAFGPLLPNKLIDWKVYNLRSVNIVSYLHIDCRTPLRLARSDWLLTKVNVFFPRTLVFNSNNRPTQLDLKIHRINYSEYYHDVSLLNWLSVTDSFSFLRIHTGTNSSGFKTSLRDVIIVRGSSYSTKEADRRDLMTTRSTIVIAYTKLSRTTPVDSSWVDAVVPRTDQQPAGWHQI